MNVLNTLYDVVMRYRFKRGVKRCMFWPYLESIEEGYLFLAVAVSPPPPPPPPDDVDEASTSTWETLS
jgi:hypothetical protein